MRIQIRILLPIISAFALLGVADSGRAASIGGSFVGRGGGAGASLAPTELAGVIAQTNWNNIDSGDPPVDGASLAQIDDAGNFTAVKIVYDINDSWNSDGGTATPNEKLMKGIAKANPDPDTAPINNSERMVFVITNLPPAGTYNIIVYAAENGNFAQMDLALGLTTYYIEEQAVFSGTFVPASSTTAGSYEQGVNYAGFTNVTPAVNGTITITATKHIEVPQVNDGIGIAAIQIVQVSGPAFPPNTDTCSITTQPQPTLVVEGANATFNVGTQGPRKIQWTKNNVPIPGAINSTLVYTAALADDGAQIRAIVYNNVNTNTSTAATLSVDANTPPVFTQGFLKVDRWENIGGATGAGGIDVLKTAISGGPPTTSFFRAGPDVPDAGIDNFGARVSGWIKPDVTGEYNFFIRSDDSSQLFLNSVNAGAGTNTLPDVNIDPPICREDGCCNGFTEPPSPRTTAVPIFLEAGKLYGIVILYKEGGGGDFVQVAWRITNSPVAAGALKPIASGNCWTLASGAGHRASLSTQPASATVFESRTASFTVGVATTPGGDPFGVAWLRNGSVIPDAAGGTYTTPPTVLADNNTQYRAIAYTLKGPLTSSIATLTVLADTNPPVPLAAAITRADGAIQVGVGFDEPVNQADLIPANFSLIGGSGTIGFPTNSFNDYKGVLFDTTGLIVGNTYTVHVANVRDPKGNAISAAGVDAAFTVGRMSWADTGTPKRPGQVVPVGADGFDILNGGRQEWSSYDEATIAFLRKTNDFDVKVQLIYAEPGSQWTRVGLQARNDLNILEDPADRNLASGSTASAYAQTHMNPNQTLGSSGRLGPAGPVDVPTVNTAPTGGTVADGTYNVKTAYVFANSPESLPSPLATVGAAGGGTSTITVDSPPAVAGATGWYAYVTQDAGTRYFRQQPGAATAIGTAFVLTATPTTSGPVTAVPVNPTPNNGHEQNRRAAMGSQSDGWGSGVAGVPVYPNEWLRLQRSGSTLHGYRSQDGVNWIDQGTTTLTDQQPHMFVGPFAAVETGNIWNGAEHDVYSSPFNPRYDRLFVYQFRNFGNTFPPSVSISGSGGSLTVTFTGTLLSAPAITGPWTPVASGSPYTTSATGAARYFRARGDFP